MDAKHPYLRHVFASYLNDFLVIQCAHYRPHKEKKYEAWIIHLLSGLYVTCRSRGVVIGGVVIAKFDWRFFDQILHNPSNDSFTDISETPGRSEFASFQPKISMGKKIDLH